MDEKTEKLFKRNVLFLCIVEIFWGMGLAFSHARIVLPAYLDDLGATNLFVGILTAIWTFGSSVPQAFSAYFTEHLSRQKRAIIILHFLPPLAWLALFLYNIFFVTGPASYGSAKLFFLPIMLFYACSLGLLMPVYVNFLSKVIEEKKRGRAFGTIFSAQCVFGALAICCIGFLVAGKPFPHNYAFLFLLTFCAICIGNLFFLPVRERSDEPAVGRRGPVEYFRTFLRLFYQERKLRKYVLIRLLTALNLLLIFFLVKHAKDSVSYLGAQPVIRFVIFLLVGQAFGNLVFGRLGDRLGFRAISVVGALLMLVSVTLFSVSHSVIIFYFAMAIAGMFLASDWIAHLNIILLLSEEKSHTRHLGFVGIATSLPLALVSLLLGYMIDIASFVPVAVATSVLAGVGSLLLYTLKMPGRLQETRHLSRETG